MEKTRAISVFTHGFLHKLLEESRKLENHATKAEEIGQEQIEVRNFVLVVLNSSLLSCLIFYIYLFSVICLFIEEM